MLDLGRLRSFAEVAERGTVVAAAGALGYTPPAVSQHIAKLEAEIDATLFDRAGGRVTLTSAGQALLPIAHEMIDLADRARSAVAQPSRRPHHIVAGFASAISIVVVPALAHLRQSMDIEVVEAEDAEAMRDLALGAANVVLTQEYDGNTVDRDPRFVYVPILREQLKLVLPGDRSPDTKVADLADEFWLLNGPGTRCSVAILRELEMRGIQPSVSGSVSDNTTLLRLVAAGQGATIVPSSVLDGHTEVVVSNEVLGTHRTILGVARAAVASDVQPLLTQLIQQRSEQTPHRTRA